MTWNEGIWVLLIRVAFEISITTCSKLFLWWLWQIQWTVKPRFRLQYKYIRSFNSSLEKQFVLTQKRKVWIWNSYNVTTQTVTWKWKVSKSEHGSDKMLGGLRSQVKHYCVMQCSNTVYSLMYKVWLYCSSKPNWFQRVWFSLELPHHVWRHQHSASFSWHFPIVHISSYELDSSGRPSTMASEK